MTAETEKNKESFFRKPSWILWTATAVVILDAVWCIVVLTLTATGHLLNSQSFECGDSVKFVHRLKKEAHLVYWWAGLNLPACVLILLECWRRHGHCIKMVVGVASILTVFMIWTLTNLYQNETQETQKFKERYLAILPLTGTQANTQNQLSDTKCDILTNIYRWQTEFKCCGLESYQDWESSIPDSCLCDAEDDNSGCIAVGNSRVYEKPCLPTVLSLIEKSNSPFWIVVTFWVTITGVPLAICCLSFAGLILTVCGFFCVYSCEALPLHICCICRWIMCREKMVPVVFIRKNNNNQTEEEKLEDGKAKESNGDVGMVLHTGDGVNVEGDEQEAAEEEVNPLIRIPLSQLRRLQEELDPPPIHHRVKNSRCMCIDPPAPRTKDFYTVLIEEESSLLPTDAVVVDANKPMKYCYWEKGHRIFCVKDIVWPKDSLQGNPS